VYVWFLKWAVLFLLGILFLETCDFYAEREKWGGRWNSTFWLLTQYMLFWEVVAGETGWTGMYDAEIRRRKILKVVV